MTQGGGFTLFFFITEGGNCENKIFDILAEPNENGTESTIPVTDPLST